MHMTQWLLFSRGRATSTQAVTGARRGSLEQRSPLFWGQGSEWLLPRSVGQAGWKGRAHLKGRETSPLLDGEVGMLQRHRSPQPLHFLWASSQTLHHSRLLTVRKFLALFFLKTSMKIYFNYISVSLVLLHSPSKIFFVEILIYFSICSFSKKFIFIVKSITYVPTFPLDPPQPYPCPPQAFTWILPLFFKRLLCNWNHTLCVGNL